MDADASTEPQFADRTGGNVDVLMGRHHGQTAALQMAGNNAGQPVDRSNVERHEGFVENPQWAFFLDQPGQRDASLLALREIAAGEVFAAGEADLLQRIESVVSPRSEPAGYHLQNGGLLVKDSKRVTLRDLSIEEPDIEDVVRRIYSASS